MELDSMFPEPGKIIVEKQTSFPRLLIGAACLAILFLVVYFYQSPKTISFQPSEGIPIVPYNSLPETISFSKAPVFHPQSINASQSINENVNGVELAKEVANKIKDMLLPYKNVEPSHITNIVSFAVKEIIKESEKPMEMNPKEMKPEKEPSYGPMNVANLPVPFREEEEDAPEKEKKGKINADANPQILAMMKARGLVEK